VSVSRRGNRSTEDDSGELLEASSRPGHSSNILREPATQKRDAALEILRQKLGHAILRLRESGSEFDLTP